MGSLWRAAPTFLAVIFAYLYYAAIRPLPQKTSSDVTETIWRRYLGRREAFLHTLSTSENEKAPLFPERESLKGNAPFYTAWDLFPAAFTCPYEMERIGLLADGGKWVCGMSQYEAVQNRPQVMYSFGIGGEVSFEVEWLRRTNTYIHAFDYSVSTLGSPKLDTLTDRIMLHQIGIAGEDTTEEGYRFSTLKSIMTDLGHDYLDVLKMDVEGSEFEALDAFMADYTGKALPIGQLLIEIHLWDSEESPDNIQGLVKWWEKLESFGLRPVASEANLLAVTVGAGFPCCSEYTFINVNNTQGIIWS